MHLPSSLEHPIAILVRGLPGSGKSYLASALEQTLGPEAVIMLDPDTIDFTSEAYHQHVAAQTAEGVEASLHPYRYLRAQAYAGIEAHKIIIWNQPFTNLEIFSKMTGRLETHAREHGTTLPIVVVEVSIDPDLAKQRVTERKQVGGHGPSDTTFQRFTREYASAGTMGYPVISVQGTAPVQESVGAVVQQLKALL